MGEINDAEIRMVREFKFYAHIFSIAHSFQCIIDDGNLFMKNLLSNKSFMFPMN